MGNGIVPGLVRLLAAGRAAQICQRTCNSGTLVEAKKLLDKLCKLSVRRYVPPFDIAVVHAALGEKDLTFALLEKAYVDRHPWLVLLKVPPKSTNCDPIRVLPLCWGA